MFDRGISKTSRYSCPVCGYPGLEKAPRSETTGSSHENCASCSFEFGYHDEDQGITDEEWRRLWIAEGMPWASRSVRPSTDWDPIEQLRGAGFWPPAPEPAAAAVEEVEASVWAKKLITFHKVFDPKKKPTSEAQKFTCTVCGCPELWRPPRSETTGPSYETCPCCGFQFGYSDALQGISDCEWRWRWIYKGLPWRSRGRLPPPALDRAEQLRRAGLLPVPLQGKAEARRALAVPPPGPDQA